MAGARSLVGAVLAACLVAVAAGAGKVDPGDITTCSSTNGTQVPHINAVKTCSSASIVSNSAKGISVAFGISHGASLVSAAGACGDAVADGVGSICRGLDAGTAIVGAAQICATALAAVYSRTASGAASAPNLKALLDPRELAGLAPTRSGYYQACTSACNNAQSAAEALAQGAACGATAATDGCVAVTAEVQSANFARAFASVAADGWSKSCARGAAAALAGTSTMAGAAAASFAAAITRVVVKACASCSTCRCSALPETTLFNTAGRWQHALSTFAASNVGLGHALASASSALCANGTKLSAHAAAEGAVLAYARMIGGALGSTKATALQLGASATACSGASMQSELQAVKEASSKVLTDAAATVFGRWCPAAAAKLDGFEVFTNDTISKLANKTAAACGGQQQPGVLSALWHVPGSLPKQASKEQLVVQLLVGHDPLRRRIGEALTEAKKCGCPPSLCLFCRPAKRSGAEPQPPPATMAEAGLARGVEKRSFEWGTALVG